MNSLSTPKEVAQSSMMNTECFDAKRPKASTIALIDNLVFSRDCLVSSLVPGLGQDISIEPFASIEEMMSSETAKFDLMLLYMHNNITRNFQTAIEAIVAIQMPVLVITDDKATDLKLSFGDVLRTGICGLVSTDGTDSKLLSAAVRFALSGGTFFPSELITRIFDPSMESLPSKKAPGGLTRRQTDVFAKLRQGKPNKIIAYELGISESTTKVHIRSIMRTIGATNRTQAVFMGQQRFSSHGKAKNSF
jgi:DNA-binding NarL/FixJ family response regulator